MGRWNARRILLALAAPVGALIMAALITSVILRGRLTGTDDPHAVTPEQLGAAMTGAGHEPEGEVA